MLLKKAHNVEASGQSTSSSSQALQHFVQKLSGLLMSSSDLNTLEGPKSAILGGV